MENLASWQQILVNTQENIFFDLYLYEGLKKLLIEYECIGEMLLPLKNYDLENLSLRKIIGNLIRRAERCAPRVIYIICVFCCTRMCYALREAAVRAEKHEAGEKRGVSAWWMRIDLECAISARSLLVGGRTRACSHSPPMIYFPNVLIATEMSRSLRPQTYVYYYYSCTRPYISLNFLFA